MSNGTRMAGSLIKKFKNDETFGTLDLKTLLYIVITVSLFQMGENVLPAFKYVAIIAMLIGLVIINPDQMAFAYIVLAASNRLLNVGANIPLLPIITVVYIGREYILKKGYKKSQIDVVMLSAILVYVLYTLRYVFTTFFLKDFIQGSKLFFSLLMLVDVFRKCKTKDEARVRYNQMIFYALLGIVLTSLISMLFSSTSEAVDRFALSSESGANILGIYSSSILAAAVVAIMSDNTVFFKQVTGIMMIPVAYIGLLTQSRTFVVLSLITILWFLAVGFGNDKSRKNTGTFVAIATVVVIVYMIVGKSTELYKLFDVIIDRFLHPRYDDVTGGRSRLARSYLTTIFSDLKYTLLGSDGSLPNPGGGTVAHNMYIEVLYDGGIIGFIIVTVMYVVFSKRIAEQFKKCGLKASLHGTLPLVICLVGGLSSHTILGAMPTNEFFIGVCSIYYFNRESSVKNRLKSTPTHASNSYRWRYAKLGSEKGEQQ